uniref:APCDD1 domain-containing protein n=1 Tax=Branchiostoma floridae TaxID=7739 RepID=C3YEG5_BRAFL|eukprot:XP_002605257.1 hypothetical protein BRAFLDRAFT_95910 [Branchiostoma floridae]
MCVFDPGLPLALLVVLSATVGAAGPGGTCGRRLKTLVHGALVVAPMPPNITGKWVSSRCEVRPGPQFITRSYTFKDNMDFQTYQFFYADQHCVSPLYTVTAHGTIILRYNNVPHQVLSRRGERDCAAGLDFVLHELQLLRVERRQDARDGHVTMELFLGDIHTDRAQRLLYRPTSYQPPLVNVELSYPNCTTCKIVQDADERRPPVFKTRQEYPLHLNGEWISMRCEVRPEALFLTRHLVFYPANKTWEGWYAHYSDPSCRHSTFSIHASGSFTRGARSSVVEGGTEYIFQVTQMRVTPQDSDTTSLLNVFHGQGCGDGGIWQIGREQDVTSTNGCVALGITLPHIEYELFDMERDMYDRLLLYIGQRPSDGTSPTHPGRRATSYQTPLVQCLPSMDTPDIRTNMGDSNISRRCTFNTVLNRCERSMSSHVHKSSPGRPMPAAAVPVHVGLWRCGEAAWRFYSWVHNSCKFARTLRPRARLVRASCNNRTIFRPTFNKFGVLWASVALVSLGAREGSGRILPAT